MKRFGQWLLRRLGRGKRRARGHLDGVFGSTAIGWAVDPAEPAAEIEILVGGAVVATGRADKFRHDIAALGHGSGHAGFEIVVPVRPRSGETLTVGARLKRRGSVLGGSPAPFQLPPMVTAWAEARSRVAGRLLDRVRRRAAREAGDRILSIVMPVYNTPDEWLREAIDSVLAQWSPAWQLVCVDDGSTLPSVRDTLRLYAARDPRIQPVLLDRNVGIARATNRGIAASRGEFVAFLDHDDVLEPDAVLHTLRAATADVDLVYTDELVVGSDRDAIRLIASRPAFSYDYYVSHPYFVHFIAVRRQIASVIGGWDDGMKISGDVDFVLRAIERSRAVAHVPVPVYRWRTHAESAGHAMKEEVTRATTGALERHFARLGIPARVSPGLGFNHYRTDFPDDDGRVGIIIPIRNKPDLLASCIAAIERTTRADIKLIVVDNQSDEPAALALLDAVRTRHTVVRHDAPFNYAAINNHAVRDAGGDCRYLLFLNNDVDAIEAGWLERLRSLAARPDVGAVGATLAYPDGRVQHAGVLVGFEAAAGHSHQFRRLRLDDGTRDPGFNGSLVGVRDYSAVTAACLMTRLDVFQEVGGFDERLVVGFNDTDLCLRIRQAGYKVLNDGATVLIHKESATRAESGSVLHPNDTRLFGDRWRELIEEGDPFYNPVLAAQGRDHELASRCPGPARRFAPRVRPVVLPRAVARRAPS